METPLQMGSFSRQSKTIALFAAPVLALLLYWVLPDAYVNGAGASVPVSHAAKACLAILLWMALWWFTETVPIAVTALLPIILYPLCDVTTLAKTLTPYASDTIYLFLGGFLLAAGIQRWGLDKRIALKTMQIVGTSPGAIIAGVMIATGFISMWVSNTATAAMMVPIAIAVMSVVRQNSDSPTITKGERNFGICVLLAVAYGASIGGMGTIIGSPPNGIFVRFVQQTYGVDVSIVQWMKVGMPVVLLLMPLSWLLLTKVLFREQIQKIAGGREWIRTELKNIGKPTRGEISVLIVFICAVVLWCLGSQIRSFTLENGVRPFKMVSDAVIAMAAGVSLFCIPVNFSRGERALDWKHCDNIPWDVLLLFGGGLSMAACIQATGAANLIAAQATSFVGLPPVLVILGVATLVIFATEFTSNTALAATMLPLLAAAVPVLGIPTEQVLLVTTIGASAAFMMPVATPPNAIIFGTGRIQIGEMIKAGFWLNVISIIVIAGVCMALGDVLQLPMPK